MPRGEVRYRLTLDSRDFDKGLSAAMTGLKNVGVATAAAAAAIGGGLVVATSRVIELGSKLADLSAKTGLTAEALQKIGFAAKLGGSDMEAAAKAVNVLQKNIVEGDKSFAKLGLSVAELRKMAPEQAFLATAEAIRQLKSPTDQAAAAMAVFGKAGADMLPAIKSGMADAAKQAEDLGLILSGETVAAADALGDSIDVLQSTFGGLLNQFGAVIVTSKPLHDLIAGVTEILGSLSKTVGNNEESLRGFVDDGVVSAAKGLVFLAEAADLANTAWLGLTAIWIGAQGAVLNLSQAMARASAAMPWTSKEAKAAYSADIALIEGEKARLGQQLADAVDARQARADQITRVKQQLETLVTTVQNGKGQVVQFKAAMDGATAGTRAFGEASQAAGSSGLPMMNLLENFTTHVRLFGKKDEGFGALKGMSIRNLGDPTAATSNRSVPREFTETLGSMMKGAFSGAIQDLPNVIMGAIQGGGNVLGAAGGLFGGALGKAMEPTLKKGLSDVLGKSLGGALGALAPGIGTLLGSGLGKLFGGIFGGSEEKKVNPVRQQFIDAAGGLDELNKKAAAAGLTLNNLLNARTVKDYEAAVRELTGAFDLQSQAQNELNAAAEKYGFTTQNQIDQMAGQLIKEWELLNAAQFNSVEITKAMAPNVLEFLNTTKQVPENMRPILEQMLQLGMLTDESGKAFGSLEEAGITFTDSLSTGLKAIVDEIRKLREALTGVRDAAGGIGGGGGGANVPGGRRGGEELSFAGGSGGFQDFGQGTPARLHGMEAVVTPGDIGSIGDMLAARIGGGGPMTVGGRLEIDLVRGFGDMAARAWQNNEGGFRETVLRDVRG